MPNGIPLDPVLPKNFDCTPNEKRSKAQRLQNMTGKLLFIV